MKLNQILNRASFKVQKHSPEILVVVGVVGVVVSAVMACKATPKACDILDEAKENLDKVHKVFDNPGIDEEMYSEEDKATDLITIYAQTGVKLAKEYAPAVILGASSIVCILASHNILSKRNIALAAAYTAIDKGFKDYRKQVVERFGEQVDKELKYRLKSEKITEEEIDEDGKKKKVKKDILVVDAPEGYSDYARFFDDSCPDWLDDAEYNLNFLLAQQRYANELLALRGHVFLNEVYDMLGIPRTKAGQIVGWVHDSDSELSDNYIDFGIYDVHCREKRDFVNGYEKAILLDFNVDGNIWELM